MYEAVRLLLLEVKREECVVCARYVHIYEVPKGVTVEARSRMTYGTEHFSRRAPSIMPPRPAPTMTMVGLTCVRVFDMVQQKRNESIEMYDGRDVGWRSMKMRKRDSDGETRREELWICSWVLESALVSLCFCFLLVGVVVVVDETRVFVNDCVTFILCAAFSYISALFQ